MNSYDTLIQQLDQFIRKFYLSKMVKGLLLFVASVLSVYLLLSIGEFAFYFSTTLRWILSIGFILLSLFSLVYWVLIPLSNYLKIGKILSHQEAAKIIGQHFPEVKDKLLNILQLNSDQASSGSQELLQASIQQKIQQISWIPFTQAVDLKENNKLLRYAIPPILLLLGIIFIAPNILTESNARLSQPAKAFQKPAPFDFKIDSKDLKVQQFKDAAVTIKVNGKILPTKIEWLQNGQRYLTTNFDANTFTYNVLNVQEDVKFRLLANGFYSDEYTLKVVKKPIVSNITLTLEYPAYTQKKKENIQNIGDVIIPAGTKIHWNLSAKNTQKLSFQFQQEDLLYLSKENNAFKISKTVFSDITYKIIAYNTDMPQGDSVLYSITVIEDQHPAILVDPIIDSNQLTQLFFIGSASDDYGISKITFTAYVKNEKDQIKKTIQNIIPTQTKTIADFTYRFDLNPLQLQAGEKVEYFFTVWDNDGIKGSKSTKSGVFVYTVPTVTELKQQELSNNQKIKSSLSSTSKEVKKLSNELKAFKEKILTKKNLSWEDKKEAQNLLEKHEKLKEELKDIKEKYDENLKNQDLFKETDQEILEKQDLLQKMFDDLLSQEMQNMMKELEELIEKFQQNNAFEKLENMQMSNDKLNKELDKMLELFKKLELEQKATDIAQSLEDLAKKQDQLQQQPDAQKQDQLNQEFQNIKKDFEHLEKLNKQQKDHLDLDKSSEKKNEIEKDMQQAKENLDKNQQQPAKKNQQDASEGMKQMAQNMRSQMMQAEMQQHAEDINTIRRILSNLLNFSKDQEDLMLRVKKTNEYDTKYSQLVQEQHHLQQESVIIEDSLNALGKRVFQLQSFITDELYKLKRDLKKSTNLLESRQRGPATAAQQYAMTSANNLALMLSEVMNQMQEQLNKMSGSAGNCSNPGGESPKPSPGDLKKLQEQLGQDLQKMGQQIKEGKSGTEINKGLAEMTQRQAAIREALRKLKENMSQQQKKDSQIDQLIDELEKNETDIVNKKINQQTILRQKNIETRMLELEKSVREQDEKDERNAQGAKDIPVTTPAQLEEFLKKQKSNVNMSKSLPPELKPFYRKLVNRYYLNK